LEEAKMAMIYGNYPDQKGTAIEIKFAVLPTRLPNVKNTFYRFGIWNME
jgi:hypothetical protein